MGSSASLQLLYWDNMRFVRGHQKYSYVRNGQHWNCSINRLWNAAEVQIQCMAKLMCWARAGPDNHNGSILQFLMSPPIGWCNLSL